MTNNDILRSFRYALDISDPGMLELFKLAGKEIERAQLDDMLKKEEQQGYRNCPDKLLGQFFDGLILKKRGARKSSPGQSAPPSNAMSNNLVLKKIRIALELKEEEMLKILDKAGITVSKGELTALFRKEGHKHYRKCGDQFLRNFLRGLALQYRK